MSIEKEGICQYHLCKEKGILYKCEYCGKYFCEKHIKPKPPLAAPFRTADPEKIEIWRDPNGHPCPPYVDFLEAKKRREKERYRESLVKLSSVNHNLIETPHISTIKIHSKGVFHKSHKKPLKKYLKKTVVVMIFIFSIIAISNISANYFPKDLGNTLKGTFEAIEKNIVIEDSPVYFKAMSMNSTAIKLEWANRFEIEIFTYIIRKEGSYPSDIHDGVLIYNGTGNFTIDKNLEPGKIYYYKAWSLSIKEGFKQISNPQESFAIPSNPSYNDIKEFVERDQTDKHEYIPGIYVCHNFAVDVIKNADKENIHAGYVTLYYNSTPIHAIVAFKTSDKGLIFLEPQCDVLFTEEKMEQMVNNGKYDINITYTDGYIEYKEYFDFEFSYYEINWDFLETYN